MKKLIASLSLVLVVALGVVGFSACKKTTIVGTWKAEKVEEYTADGKLKASSTDLTYLTFNTITFKKDGTCLAGNGEDYEELTWTKENGKIVLAGLEETFTIKKGKLVMKSRLDSDGEYWCLVFKKVK